MQQQLPFNLHGGDNFPNFEVAAGPSSSVLSGVPSSLDNKNNYFL
jgi:hypothetical protein